MKTINKIKNLKPTELEVSFKYVCPNCSASHWALLREVQYDKFVIVCECKYILKPKLIEDVKALYSKKKKKETNLEVKENKEEEGLSPATLASCSKALAIYGFDVKEAEELIEKAYKDTKITDCAALVKISLSNFGGRNG